MIHLVPIIPIVPPATGPVDLLSLIPMLVVVLGIPLLFRFGLMLGGHIIKLITDAFVPPVTTFDALQYLQDDKPKREEPVSFFDQPTEPDYVVGFGDDGELVYASEQKPKNDEVIK